MSSPEPWLHFVGVGGSGMSALALFHAGRGGRATGSDRAFDRGEREEIRRALEAAGVIIVPQDGNAITHDCDAVVVSTAVEGTILDVRAARALGIAVLHRSELLARFVQEHRTIAVTGTSGKSTVTAMIFTVLRGCGHDPRLLTGGALVALQRDGYLGNAWGGDGDGGPTPWLVIEADESDGSVVRYHPWCGVVLNLGRDHKEPEDVAAMFDVFKANVTGPLIVGEGSRLDALRTGAVTFGLGAHCDVRAEALASGPRGSAFTVQGVRFSVPTPGRHDVRNAAAAIAACRAAGVALDAMIEPLAGFAGVVRRFQSLGHTRGVEVIDDFAHNPDKLTAALAAAHARLARPDSRVLAIFQPHGFGPTRFLRHDLVDALATSLQPQDVLWLPEIYYAGGTVTRDISSADLVGAIRAKDRDARFVSDRAQLPAAVAAEAREGDLVMVMGARDPSLTALGRDILAALGD